MQGTGRTIEIFMTGILTVAIIAVLVSNKATTSTLISSISTALTSIFQTILSPVTGSTTTSGS